MPLPAEFEANTSSYVLPPHEEDAVEARIVRAGGALTLVDGQHCGSWRARHASNVAILVPGRSPDSDMESRLRDPRTHMMPIWHWREYGVLVAPLVT